MDMYLSVPFCFWHLLIYLFAFIPPPPQQKTFFGIESIFFHFHLHRNAKNLL